MRISIILMSAVFLLTACEHKGVNEFATSESVTVSPGTYALASAAPSNATIPPSNPCAEGYDDVITHLEKLMAKNNPQQQPQ